MEAQVAKIDNEHGPQPIRPSQHPEQLCAVRPLTHVVVFGVALPTGHTEGYLEQLDVVARLL